jgi:hypothetical protein
LPVSQFSPIQLRILLIIRSSGGQVKNIFGMENAYKIVTQNTTLMKRRNPAIVPTTIEGKKFNIMTFLKIHNINIKLGEHKKKGGASQEHY